MTSWCPCDTLPSHLPHRTPLLHRFPQLVELHRPLAATDRLSTVVVQTAEKALAKWDSELDTALRRSRLAASRKASASGGAGGSMDEEDEAPSPLTSITQFAADGSGAAAVRVRVELGTIVRKFEMPRTATLAALWGECTRLFGRQCTPCAMNADGEFAEITSDVRAPCRAPHHLCSLTLLDCPQIVPTGGSHGSGGERGGGKRPAAAAAAPRQSRRGWRNARRLRRACARRRTAQHAERGAGDARARAEPAEGENQPVRPPVAAVKRGVCTQSRSPLRQYICACVSTVCTSGSAPRAWPL